MKKLIILIFCVTLFSVSLCGCTYYPPEGYTEVHHTYDEILAYAKTLDPAAVVSEEYTDTVDEYDWEFREWDAVINGVDCHVSSVSDWVWNDGFMAGEFVKVYYRIDTDFDYVIMQNILAEKHPNWRTRDGIYSKYHNNSDTIFAELVLSEYRMLSDDELEQVWKTAFEINNEYEKYAIGRKAEFSVPAPGKYWNHHGEQEYFVKKDSFTYIEEFTEQGKDNFFMEYHDDWALLESDLPIYE